MLLLGHLGCGGAAGTSFSRTKNQPKKDLRPHIQLIFYGLLLGVEESKEEFWSDAFNFRRDVSCKHFLIIPAVKGVPSTRSYCGLSLLLKESPPRDPTVDYSCC